MSIAFQQMPVAEAIEAGMRAESRFGIRLVSLQIVPAAPSEDPGWMVSGFYVDDGMQRGRPYEISVRDISLQWLGSALQSASEEGRAACRYIASNFLLEPMSTRPLMVWTDAAEIVARLGPQNLPYGLSERAFQAVSREMRERPRPQHWEADDESCIAARARLAGAAIRHVATKQIAAGTPFAAVDELPGIDCGPVAGLLSGTARGREYHRLGSALRHLSARAGSGPDTRPEPRREDLRAVFEGYFVDACVNAPGLSALATASRGPNDVTDHHGLPLLEPAWRIPAPVQAECMAPRTEDDDFVL